MADHLPVVLLKYGGVWQDVTADVSQVDPLKVTTGAAEISEALKASKVELTFEDPAGRYRVHDPMSPLYGIAGRNTPMTLGREVLAETFESATLGITVSAGASVNPWARSTTSPHSGAWCYKSGATADSAFSDAIITVPPGANTCVLWYRTDSSATDVLRVSAGGFLRLQTGGTGGAWTQLLVPTTGSATVYLRYLKDAAGSAGADAVYVDDIRFLYCRSTAEVSSWRPGRTLGFTAGVSGRQSCEITAEGLLRRIGNWDDVLQSAMTRSILGRATLLGFWPGEDPRGATAMSNLTAGSPATVANVTFGDDESPGGGSTSVQLQTTSTINGAFLSGSSTGWQVSWTFRLPAIPALGTPQPLIRWWTSNGALWQVSVNSGSYQVDVTASDGTSLVSAGTTFGVGAEPNQWITMRLQVSITGGTVTYSHGWYAERLPVIYLGGSSFAASSLGKLSRWRVTGNAYNDGGWIAYVYAVTGVTDSLLDASTVSGLNGYAGETAGARFARLMAQELLASNLIGSAADTELMGAQRPGRLFDLLQECRDTDGALIYDGPTVSGVTMRTRRNLYRQTPKLTLTYGVNVAEPFDVELDDLGTANQVTVSQRDGGSVTVVDSTSRMGTAPPPAGVGVYKREVPVNVFDEARLSQLAGWHLALGTVPDPRYSSVTVDLDAHPELESAAEQVQPGDRITISGPDPDVIDLLVVSPADRQPNQKRRTITYTCVPYRPYATTVYDETGRRYDSRGSTLAAGYSTTAPTMVVTYTDVNDGWSTTATPYDWQVAGERITVTAMGARTGAGPYTQTATVTRSVNGVVKAQLTGEPVHMHPAQAARYAL